MAAFIVLATMLAVQMPPRAYDYPPRVRVQIIEGTQAEVHRVCRKVSRYSGSGSILACAIPGKRVCIILWPRHVRKSGALWRHERSHCNGWVH